ncbi:cell envelope integrity protein TolA [Elizabethkingia anophelis]|uniref:cell envelope integrity protein TolA n=3 Tax=Weeksellaceae TaxID=2762318 RepID=UPI000A60BDA0|nr:cell envelope integrity protein TolA [Elizabethkingia anophelis]MCT3652790.1 cell envelope integrity protein TolA [Elizabethkingia anophelis]MCT3654583.1 cell envelope integrity protein TolA [Elizabethkingia anophelis]MCT3860498.1 cell envelope integrity protein TolA [Elizabethkingia anophelis]MCT3913803.1 cell envelope integrity protein TolA [Elizabethkingia anophelis]MCT3938789.1 cell envelope integrity protein TolA [Elizabethkingia anophelis]
MKKYSLLLLIFFFINIVIAQKKKIQPAAIKSKQEIGKKASIPLLEKDINSTLEELEPKISKAGFFINELKERLIPYYNDQYQKTGYGTEKIIVLKNNSYITLKTNVAGMVSSLEITTQQNSLEAMKKLSGLNNFNLLKKRANQEIYELGKYTGVISKEGSSEDDFISISIFRNDFGGKQYLNSISLMNITMSTNFNEAMGMILSFLRANNQKIYSVSQPSYNETEVFTSKSQDIFFTTGQITLTENANHRLSLNIFADNPLLANNICQYFKISEWEPRYVDKNGAKYFKKNQLLLLHDKSYVNLIVLIPKENTEQKLTQSTAPDFFTLSYLHSAFSNRSDLIKYLDDHYLYDYGFKNTSEIQATKNGFFMSKMNDKLVRYYIGDENETKTNWGFIFLVDSYDKTIQDEYQEMNNTDEYVSRNYSLNDMPGLIRVQYYLKPIYQAAQAKKDAEDSYAEIKKQQREAEEKQEEIAKERRKAEKAKNFGNAMNTLTGELNKLINIYKKN